MSFIGSLGSHQPKGIAGVRDFLRFKAMLTSHQWVSAHHPDPEGQQLKVFQAVMMNLLNGSTEAKPTLCSEIISVAGRSRSVWVALGYRPFFLLHMGSLRCPATERSLETFEEKWGDQRRFHQLQIPVESARVVPALPCGIPSLQGLVTGDVGERLWWGGDISHSAWSSCWWETSPPHHGFIRVFEHDKGRMDTRFTMQLCEEILRWEKSIAESLRADQKPSALALSICSIFWEQWSHANSSSSGWGQSQPARHPRMNTKKDHRLLWQRWRRTVTAWSVRRPLHHQRIWCPISLRFWRHTSCQRTFAFHQPHCQPCKQKRRPRIFAPAALLLQIGCDINGGVWYQTPSRPPPRLPGSRCVASAVVGPWGTFFATRMTRERTTRRVAPQDPDPMVSMA